MEVPAQKSVVGDTDAKNFWKLYAGKLCDPYEGNPLMENSGGYQWLF